MSRGAWTEDRLNEQGEKVQQLAEEVARIGPAVDKLTTEVSELRKAFTDETRSLRDTMAGDNRALRQELSDLQGRLTMIGFGLVGSVIAAAVAIIIAILTH
jgi:tetrahydromethanopterin S-methyltransferase subunit B